MKSNKIKRKNLKITLKLRRIIILTILFFMVVIFVFILKNILNSKHTQESINSSNTVINSATDNASSQMLNENTDLSDFKNWNKSCDWNLIVVNADNEISNDFNVCLSDNTTYKVDARISEDLTNMIDDAASDNITLWVSSGFRDISLQTELFNNQVKRNLNAGYSEYEAADLAKTVVAKPRTSEHHTGLAVDLNGVEDDFYTTNEYKWLIENDWKYGFILRYPKDKTDITNVIFEPWHFRYIGKKHAKKINDSGLCLEEYIDTLK